MPDCEFLVTCPFFGNKMANMPATAELYKRRYCKGDYSKCARFMIAKTVGREKMPPDLFPNQHERAIEIISKAKEVSAP